MAHIDVVSDHAVRRPVRNAKATKKTKAAKPIEHFIDPAKLPRAKYALKVAGDCMAPAVNEGDHVLVDPTVEPKTGDLVIIYLKKGYHWEGNTNAGLKRVVFNMMPGIKYPYVAHPNSNVIPVLIVEQDTPKRQYQIRADMLLGVHKCLGPVPKGTKLVKKKP
jgi:hypothetical protein